MSESNAWFDVVMVDINRIDGIGAAIAWVENKGGPFSTWERLAFPEWPCQQHFEDAIYISFADPSHEFSKKYLSWAIDTSKRALEDPRFTISAENSSKGWMNKPAFPGNVGMVRAIHALSVAVFNQSAVDADELKKSSSEIATSALFHKGKSWSDDAVQRRYLYAVRLAMIAGDWEGANHLLAVKRKFDALTKQFEILVAALRFAVGGKSEQASLELFEEHFQAIRRPGGKDLIRVDAASPENSYRLELSLIRQRLMQAHSFPDWKLIFESINRES